MAEVTREAIAEMLAVYVCVSREDLRVTALDGSWAGWNDLLIDDQLDKINANNGNATYRDGIRDELGNNDLGAIAALHDLIDRSWRPPCPKKGAIDAAFHAMCDYYRV